MSDVLFLFYLKTKAYEFYDLDVNDSTGAILVQFDPYRTQFNKENTELLIDSLANYSKDLIKNNKLMYLLGLQYTFK
ncbi:hypothetical protein [Rickettsiella endosymbiont of Xylota segnis]|uniref:hypothetical protein n=1 Tax=Rickettsiella endosymbiont of Xylota segnis TaxID=3066238 RepID=UPI0030CD3A4D